MTRSRSRDEADRRLLQALDAAMTEARQTDRCRLCGRAGVRLTRHHLIPKRTHRLKRIRRRFDRAAREGRLLHVCRPCHKQIHAVLEEKELAERYHHREALLAHPEIAKFVAWIADKPPGFVPQTHRRTR